MDARRLRNDDHAERARSAPRSSDGERGAFPPRPRERVVLQLQALAGNRAVAHALKGETVGHPVVQRVTVTLEPQDGVEPKIRAAILQDVTEIVSAAEAAAKTRSKERRGPMLTQLEGLIGSLRHAAPTTSSGTYGLSGASYFQNVATMGVEGPRAWQEAVSAGSSPEGSSAFAQAYPQTTLIDVGKRDTHVHDEMVHITELPGVQAVAATQPNCLFCYGVLEQRGYEHGRLREQPWPDGWSYPSAGFRLLLAKDILERRSQGPIITIATSEWGSRRYHVVDLWRGPQ